MFSAPNLNLGGSSFVEFYLLGVDFNLVLKRASDQLKQMIVNGPGLTICECTSIPGCTDCLRWELCFTVYFQSEVQQVY